jgi:HEXXH motif-containing protein
MLGKEGWLPGSSSGLIPILVTAQTNQRLAELALFARTVKAHGDADSQLHMEQAMHLARALPPGALAAVLSEPEFHYWSYIALCLRGRQDNGEAVPATDVPHLSTVLNYAESPLLTHVLDLNRFLLAAALIAGVETQLIVPLHGNELAIPGLGIFLRVTSSAPTVDVTLVWSESAQLLVNSIEIAGFPEALAAAQQKCGAFAQDQLWVLPWVRMSSGAFVINGRDPYFRLAWVTNYRNADGSQYSEVPSEEYAAWEQDLKATVTLLAECWPEMEQEIGQALRAIIPVRSHQDSIHVSCSKDVMAFALLMSTGSPAMLAEAIIHEFGHNVLNVITEFDEVFAEPRRTQPDLYSPWRPDARPLGGLLHAVFVFERVCEFYLRYLSRHVDEEITHRFRLMTLRNVIGLEVVQPVREALGSAGKEILSTLQARVKSHAERLTPADWELAKEELIGHFQVWQLANPLAQCPASGTLLLLSSSEGARDNDAVPACRQQ